MRSLYFRVFMITIYAITLSSLLGFYTANVYYQWELKPYNDAKLSGIVGQIRDYVERFPEQMGDYFSHAASLGYQLYLIDEEGNEMYYGAPFRVLDLGDDVRRSVLEGMSFHGVAEYPNKPFVTGYFENRLSNSVGVPMLANGDRYALFLRPDIRLQFGELRSFFAMILAFAVLFSIPFFLISTRYLVHPVTRLKDATKLIAQGHYTLKLPTKRKDEIGQLAQHFQKMSTELERSDKAKKEFVANVSHEIQSPLTSIQGFADSLLQEEADEQRRRHYASVIGQEARRLAALSRQLLLLSTLDNTGSAVEKRSFGLQPQIRQALQLLEWQLTEKEIAVRLRLAPQLYIVGDEVLLMQVWSNLLSNAVKHIPEGSTVTVEAYREDRDCVILIADTGNGIPEEQLPYIYDRFYRGDSARQRGSGSTGLGLAIVQKIVYLHGGTIEAESRMGVGTTFCVRIPD
ncbi:sensor histidine kinase [Paenibacillus sp. NPDC058071]|uniref:sensor histidine kinase n=1 Tax=Paenibacillus sp. NPDC058071 TaxID=3346326 RepID=UPI0036DD1CF5